MAPFLWKTRLLFVDTDASGRIHYSALFRHVEAAEMEFFRSIGRPFGGMSLDELKYPRVRVEADYKAPLVCVDPMDIHVWVDRIGATSYTMAYSIRKGEVEAASAKLVVVCMSTKTKKGHPLPAELVEKLKPYLKDNDCNKVDLPSTALIT